MEAQPSNRVLVGIGWMLLTTVFFVGVTGIVRYVGTSMPAPQAAFIRYAIGCCLVLPFLLPLLRVPPSKKVLGLFVCRGLLHGVAVTLWFFAMARIPIAEVTAIGFTTPLFVTVGAWFFFREQLRARRLAALAIGIFGAFVILRPGFQEVKIGALAQLGAAPLFAISFLIAKRLTLTERPAAIVGMLSIFCTLALLPGAITTWRDPTWSEVLWLGLTALVATMGHYTQTRAFQAAPLTVTQPIGFLQLLWAALLGMLVFGEPLDPYVFIGGGIVVAAATFISHREMVAARRAKKAALAAAASLDSV